MNWKLFNLEEEEIVKTLCLNCDFVDSDNFHNQCPECHSLDTYNPELPWSWGGGDSTLL